MPKKYFFEFTAWPLETVQAPAGAAIRLLLELLRRPVIVTMTGDEFGDFQHVLLARGITLRDIKRYPYNEPEVIF